VGNPQSLSSLNLSGQNQITVLDRTTTAVPLPSATRVFWCHESLSRVAAINGLRCPCPDLTHAKAGLLFENRNGGIGTVIDAIHRTGRLRPVQRPADPDLLRFVRRMCGTPIQEESRESTEGLREIIHQTGLGQHRATALFERFERSVEETLEVIVELEMDDLR
jgi:hypothetical protein